ncbi:MAG: hypothetical protein BRD41_03040 [Bacteroidetes bacterium QS_1_63_11]|nr:MAG: hypothetical protein BRD41_03040 [Bacteroidetes bacterium QS_1_63_11]
MQGQGVPRDEYREVLSRLDILENEIEERFGKVNERLDRTDERLGQMTDQLDRMNDRILSMTRWLIGLLVAFGTMGTVLMAIAQFNT